MGKVKEALVDEDALAEAEASYSAWYAKQEALVDEWALFDDDDPADRAFEEDWFLPQQDAHCYAWGFAAGLYEIDMPF